MENKKVNSLIVVLLLVLEIVTRNIFDLCDQKFDIPWFWWYEDLNIGRHKHCLRFRTFRHLGKLPISWHLYGWCCYWGHFFSWKLKDRRQSVKGSLCWIHERPCHTFRWLFSVQINWHEGRDLHSNDNRDVKNDWLEVAVWKILSHNPLTRSALGVEGVISVLIKKRLGMNQKIHFPYLCATLPFLISDITRGSPGFLLDGAVVIKIQ